MGSSHRALSSGVTSKLTSSYTLMMMAVAYTHGTAEVDEVLPRLSSRRGKVEMILGKRDPEAGSAG